MSISSKDLRGKITVWGLSQVEFARWLQVSTGAVTQWLAETRSIPGPVNAFIKLFESLPPSLQEREFSQFKKGNTEMEGMYTVEFAGSGGNGSASLIFKDGLVYGFDGGRASYDGRCRPSEKPGMTIIEVSVKMPAGIPSVIRGLIHPFDWSVSAKAEIPNNAEKVTINVNTNMEEIIEATFTRMRDLPMAA